jgi:hypothetical protein
MNKTPITMATWVVEALEELGGSASFSEIGKRVWQHHETEIRTIDNLLYD